MNNEAKIRVILADDHAVVRAGIKQFLEYSNKIEVIAEAEDGVDALKLIDELHPDVVVLDIQMPRMTGIEVVKHLKKEHSKVGILILTAYDDDPYIIAVLQAGANGYVLKTASPIEIVRAVQEVFEGKSALDNEITQKLVSHLTRPDSNSSEEPYESLTSREVEVLELTARGLTNKAIGIELDISNRTVQGHLARIYSKLNASSRTEAVMKGVALGLIQAETPNE